MAHDVSVGREFVSDARRISLAHVPDFGLGTLTVRPAVRQLVRTDGVSEVLEPRVMQVLVALARADGAIVTRSQLTECCWDGRIVGEDAINRVISRLRRLSEGIAAGAFRVETITKVGYRLLCIDPASAHTADAQSKVPPAVSRPDRRALIAGGLSAAVAIGGGAMLWRRSQPAPPSAPSAEAAILLEQGLTALRQPTRDSQNSAMGLLRRLVMLYPGYGDGWGALAMTYAFSAHWRAPADGQAMRQRAAAAADRSLSIDPANAYAQVARAILMPTRGGWVGVEQALRRALVQHPTNTCLTLTLGLLMQDVGRPGDAVRFFQIAMRQQPVGPIIYFHAVLSLWSANRLEEVEALIGEALQTYPGNFALWFARVYILMFTGRAAAATGVIDDLDGRPSGISLTEFADIRRVSQAIASRRPADAADTMRYWMDRAHEGSGYAENAMQFACALGQVDQAFAIADAYYFNRGFTVPDLRFTPEQGTYTPLAERETWLLFNPATAPMRADRRFGPLVAAIGLENYWKQAGVEPDYRRA